MAAGSISLADVTRKPKPLYDRWFTTCPQDWFIMVVRGEDLHKIIHSVKGWYVDEKFRFQPEDRRDPNKTRYYTPLRVALGHEFVGIPGIQGIYVYKFAWNKYWRKSIKNPETGEVEQIPEYTVKAHDEENVFITPFNSQYPLQYGGIEVLSSDRNKNDEEALIPITLTITVRLRMRKPQVALMENTDWFGQVLSPSIQKAAKEFSGNRFYDQMIKEAKEKVSGEFADTFMKGGLGSVKANILKEAGVEITSIGITDIKPNEEFEKALLNQAIAEREAKAKIAKAEGDKRVRILAGEAEKEYERLVGEGKAARILAEAEADRERILKTVLTATGGPGPEAAKLERYREMRQAGLLSYSEGGGPSGATILVGADGKPLRPAA